MLQQPDLTSLHELPVRPVIVPLTEVLDGSRSLRGSLYRFFLRLLRLLLLLSFLFSVRFLFPMIGSTKHPLLFLMLLYSRLLLNRFRFRLRFRRVRSISRLPTTHEIRASILLLQLPSLLVAFFLDPVILLRINIPPQNNLQNVLRLVLTVAFLRFLLLLFSHQVFQYCCCSVVNKVCTPSKL